MTFGHTKKIAMSAVLLSVGLEAAASAQAQSTPDTGLEEIIVTAQKREQSLQDVGVAVTALGENALKLLAPSDSTALAKVVPSLQVNQYSPSQTVYNLRGVSQNDFSDIQEGPVAFYNDEVYIGSLGAISGQTFDLQRVEVLRGPQGTLFGRNATGGLVQVITAKPTKVWEGYGTLTFGSYDQISAEAGVGGPLSDRVRMRLSGVVNYNDGYVRNIYPGGRDGGNTKFQAVRGQLEFDVGDTGLLRLKAEYLHNDHETSNAVSGGVARPDPATGLGVAISATDIGYGACAGCNPLGYRTPSDPFTQNADFPGLFNRNYWSLSARYEQDFGSVQFTSISNYQHLSKATFLDYDGTPNALVQGGLRTRLYQLSQELRLSGKTDRLNWVAGVYGMRIDADTTSGVAVDPLFFEFQFGLPYTTLANRIDYSASQKTDTLAAFAQLEYKLTDVFTVTGGFRYSVDWKNYRFRSVDSYPNLGFIGFPSATYVYDFNTRQPGRDHQSFKNWSGKLQLNAKLNDGLLLYAGVNRGTKAGGFNTPNAFPTSPGLGFASPAVVNGALAAFDARMVFDQEVLTNYEAGFKFTSANRKLTLNGALFHYDYKNYQSFEFVSANGVVVNHPAKVTGAELELNVRPTSWLMVGAFASHLFEATVKNVTLPTQTFPQPIVDRELPQAPEWSAGGSVTLRAPVGDLGSLAATTNWKYNSAHYLAVLNAPVTRQAGYAVGDVRLSFEDRDHALEVAVFVNNVTNEVYRVFAGDNSFATSTEIVYGRPRWFGGSLTYRFGH